MLLCFPSMALGHWGERVCWLQLKVTNVFNTMLAYPYSNWWGLDILHVCFFCFGAGWRVGRSSENDDIITQLQRVNGLFVVRFCLVLLLSSITFLIHVVSQGGWDLCRCNRATKILTSRDNTLRSVLVVLMS